MNIETVNPYAQIAIGQRIKKHRIAADLTQAELAEKTRERGVEMQKLTVHNIESSKRRLSLIEAWAIALALDCKVVDLLPAPARDDSEPPW